MSRELELVVQGPHFDTRVLLDGRLWRFSFYTNTIDGGWYFDLANEASTFVVRGVGLSNGVELLHPYRAFDVPPGPLWVKDKGLNGEDPDLDAFEDKRASLLYLEGL